MRLARQPVRLLLFTVLVLVMTAGAQPAHPQARATESVLDFSRALQACVKVHTYASVGSGVVVDDSHVVTNHHVIEGSASGELFLQDGTRVPFTVLRSDAGLDLAVLSADVAAVGSIEWTDSDSLTLGDEVAALGFPSDLEKVTVTRGIVSAPTQPINGQDYVQTDAAINPGNSGGPLVDEFGRLAGINTFILQDTVNLGFAVPSNRVRDYVASAGIQLPPSISGSLPQEDPEPAPSAPSLEDKPDEEASPPDDGEDPDSTGDTHISPGTVYCTATGILALVASLWLIRVFVREAV